MSKIKVLLVGTIGDGVEDFCRKISSLQQSKAGPFDVCFCVGPANLEALKKQASLPLPVYIPDDSRQGLIELATNLHVLGGADVWSLDISTQKQQLVVASCPPRLRLDSAAAKPLLEKVSHVSYVGCDVLLSSEWPQGVENVLGEAASSAVVGSYDVAELALRARPRYHVAPHNVHLQSLPFRHLAATSSTFQPKHVGRFLTLANVVSPAQFKQLGKTHKFVHALGLEPLHGMTAEELDAAVSASQVQPCPYTDASYTTSSSGKEATTTTNVGLSEAQARRILSESSSTGGDTHTRWKTGSRKRAAEDRDNSNNNQNDDDDDPSNTTLFLHGLHKDVRGTLQTASGVLLRAFSKYQVERVRRPPAASSYAFLEFPSHDLAKQCLVDLGGETVIEGVHLTLKWATVNPNKSKGSSSSAASKKRRLTEAEAMDSCTLYFRLPPKVLTAEVAQASEDTRKLMERCLEHALGDPNVTAETEPALQVKVRVMEDSSSNVDNQDNNDERKKKNFGFLEFASHAAASMAVASLTGSTDGGLVTAESSTSELPADTIPPHLLGVALHWAHDHKPSDGDSKGLKFQRKHFPADARTDCWFCLASSTCEKHLITSVHDECYMAMPKGPVDPGHVLLIPVTHSSTGALVDQAVASEMEGLKQRLRQHALDVWEKDLFVFERAIQTKGGYHTHVQCIPVKRGMGIQIQAAMVGMARSISGFDLKELNSDLALTSLMTSTNDDEENDGGYFYAEVPVSVKECKRFLYKAKSTKERQGGAKVPLQFGREVLATVLENPELAHWKACVLDEEKETELANEFRASFAEYLP